MSRLTLALEVMVRTIFGYTAPKLFAEIALIGDGSYDKLIINRLVTRLDNTPKIYNASVFCSIVQVP